MAVTHDRGDIAIIGGSMAGLLAGLLLRRKGWRVNIYERSGTALASRGAGITPHEDLFEAFALAGLDLSKAMGVESIGRIMFRHNGEVRSTHDETQIFTSWGLLYRFLRRAFPDNAYHDGVALEQITIGENGPRLSMSDGQCLTPNFVIGADGVRSLVRHYVSPESQIEYTGYVAWRGLCNEEAIPNERRQQLDNRMAFYLPPAEHMLGYTVAGPNDDLRIGHRWYNWVWYRGVSDRAYTDMFTGTDGTYYGDGIPPQLICEDQTKAMRMDAQRLLPPQFRDVIDATKRPFIQPIVEVVAERLTANGMILIGDAAATARPHIGTGVSKAAADATSLADALDAEPTAIADELIQWEEQQLNFARAVVARSADLGCYIGKDPVETPNDARHRHFRNPATVLSGIAAANPRQHLTL